jgi:CBS-domain-containing membrane protein
MFSLRCLHPPGGAVALLTALTHADAFGFVLFPVLTNSALLAFAGILYNTATGRRYPHSQIIERTNAVPGSRFSSADLDRQEESFLIRAPWPRDLQIWGENDIHTWPVIERRPCMLPTGFA